MRFFERNTASKRKKFEGEAERSVPLLLPLKSEPAHAIGPYGGGANSRLGSFGSSRRNFCT